uniref:Fe2OG dioxygenase domain-containing protein n=1 Tax=Salix viminalis TaxID=40686 RepID=A0A6N2L3B4_SALVM
MGDWVLNASLFLPFKELQSLDLSRNGLVGCSENQGFEILSSELRKLLVLDLSYNKFNSDGILSCLAGLSSLKSFDLSWNTFTGSANFSGLNILSSRLKKLEKLYLRGNQYSDSIFSSLTGFSSLKSLDLSYNMLTGSTGTFFNSIILEELYLDGSSLPINFIQNIGALSALKVLSVGECDLNVTLLAQGLCELKNLEQLILSANNLRGSLPDCFRNLSSLQVFDISRNNFTGNIASGPLTNLLCLEFLSLSNNHFEVPISMKLFMNHSSLEFFSSDNNRPVTETTSFHDLIPKFQPVFFSLSSNPSQALNVEIPNFLYNQHDLRILDPLVRTPPHLIPRTRGRVVTTPRLFIWGATGVISIGQDSIFDHVENTTNQDNVEAPPIQEIVSEEQPRAPLESMPLRRSTREKISAISDDYIVFLQEHEIDIGVMEDDPISFHQAIGSSNSQKWIYAMNEEIKSMKDNNVWDLVPLPEGTKRDSKGDVEKYKARLVAKGFTHKEGINYKETFSPVSSKDSFRIIMALVAHFNLELYQMDVKTAFLSGNIDETIYMLQPENFVSGDPKNIVCKLKKSIYGLKQASRQWYFKFHQVIISFGFEMNLVDDCIYHKFCGSKYIFLVLYVDDILLASSDIGLLHETKKFLAKNFEMKDLGEASFVLGIQIHRDHSRSILGLSQKSYIKKVLKRYGMQDCKPGDTPVAKGDKFSLNQCPKNDFEKREIQKIPYASVVGSLMYAQVCTRPDIAYIIGILGRYLSNPGIDHWKAAKRVLRVLRYLQRTKDYMLTYRSLTNLEIIGYSNSDYAGCLDSMKSTSGYIYMLAGGAVSWKSVKQSLIASSTMAAEFIACYEASNHGVWLRNFVTGLHIVDDIERPLKLFCDNKSTVLYSNNNRSSSKSKHIDIKFLVVKKRVQSGQLSIEHIGINSMVADPLTKGLPPKMFHEHTARMGVLAIDKKTKVKVERTKGLSKEYVLIWKVIRTTLYSDFRIWIQINHGVTEDLMNDTMNVFKEFFKLPEQDKTSFYCEDPTRNDHCMLYTSSLLYATEDVHLWRDNLRNSCHPLEECIQHWPEKPARYRHVVGAYATEVKKLAATILELICEGLGLESGYLGGKLSEIPRNGEWIGVEPISTAFVVNMGYQMQIISNNKLRSVEHRAVTNSEKARTSVAMFFIPNGDSIVEPAKALVDSRNPAIFKSFQYKEFITHFLNKTGGIDVALESFKLQGQWCGRCYGCLEEERIGLLEIKALIDPNSVQGELSDWMDKKEGIGDCCQAIHRKHSMSKFPTFSITNTT